MPDRKNVTELPPPCRLECPSCGSIDIETAKEIERFKYGKDDAAVELSAIVPVRTCTQCGFQFTDAEAEDAHHEAVCQHLGVLSPRQITAVRMRYGLSRAEFAEITRIGEASLHRWETGQLVQNPGYDQLLYLLRFPTNMDRLRQRAAGKTTKGPVEQSQLSVRFPNVINIAQAHQHASAFRLRLTGS